MSGISSPTPPASQKIDRSLEALKTRETDALARRIAPLVTAAFEQLGAKYLPPPTISAPPVGAQTTRSFFCDLFRKRPEDSFPYKEFYVKLLDPTTPESELASLVKTLPKEILNFFTSLVSEEELTHYPHAILSIMAAHSLQQEVSYYLSGLSKQQLAYHLSYLMPLIPIQEERVRLIRACVERYPDTTLTVLHPIFNPEKGLFETSYGDKLSVTEMEEIYLLGAQGNLEETLSYLPSDPPTSETVLLQIINKGRQPYLADLNATLSKLLGELSCTRPEVQARLATAVAQRWPANLIEYASNHPEIASNCQPAIFAACKKFLTDIRQPQETDERPPPLRGLSIIKNQAFIQVLIEGQPWQETLRLFIEFKSFDGLVKFFASPLWQALPLAEKEHYISEMTLRDLTLYTDQEIASLVTLWEEKTRAAFIQRISFLNPEAMRLLPDWEELAPAEFADLETTLSQAEGSADSEYSRAFNAANANSHGNQGLYKRAFAKGKNQALWGIRKGKSWEDIITALAIRRRRLAFEQKMGWQRDPIQFGTIRTRRCITPISPLIDDPEGGFYDRYVAQGLICQSTLHNSTISYTLDDHPPYLLTQFQSDYQRRLGSLSFFERLYWKHLAPQESQGGGWFVSPLMQRAYTLLDQVKDDGVPQEEALNALAEAHWLFSHMMPFERGSPTVMEMLTEALMLQRGIRHKPPAPGEERDAYDCRALVTPNAKKYQEWYRSLPIIPAYTVSR